MQLPEVEPYKENAVFLSKEEFMNEIRDALKDSSGIFLKLFIKDSSNKYYFTVLIGRNRLMGIEGEIVDTQEKMVGKEAINVLSHLLSNPLIVDIYKLDEITLKISLADNIDIYTVTPKLELEELLKAKKIEVKPSEQVVQKKMEEKPIKKEEPQKAAEEITPPKPEMKEAKEKKVEKEEKRGEKKEEGVIIDIQLTGPEAFKAALESAFQEYLSAVFKDIQRMKNTKLKKVEIKGDVGTGVVYTTIHIYGESAGSSSEADLAKRKVLYFANRHIPLIGRLSGLKPILSGLQAEIIPTGAEDTKKETSTRIQPKKLKDDGVRIVVNAPPQLKPFFTAYAKNILNGINGMDFKPKYCEIDVIDGKSLELHVFVKGSSSTLSRIGVITRVEKIAKNHAKNLSREIRRSISIDTVDAVVERVEMPQIKGQAAQTAPTKAQVDSRKVEEILKKKALIEAEVEKLLKEAGVDELSYLTEEKKKETTETVLRTRVEPAMKSLRERIQAELSVIPRTKFKWLKMNWDFKESIVEVNLEVSFSKEVQEGLFGSFSGISDEKIRQEAQRAITNLMHEIGREYGVAIKPKTLNIIIH
ncbi:hypothetical protein PAP_07790 [Palaeococcus pacificus DY20341]|uniref:Uncharacterized protein n=1 Tax=Palaeococcus pacificus DY20341 TaxID=1343739 RepID=A0A075LVB5_9EURY|nr:hypothetical protein [Palaeococcus pacificus]AIF69947.1 hypothetical protein PAP_07790 [Palaeococcus pacificus DY20341]